MKFSDYKKLTANTEFERTHGIYEYRSESDKRRILVRDVHSYRKDDGWHVYPIALTDVRVFIVCPYCGSIHMHGNDNGHYEGARAPHCNTERGDYTIERL